ncbi:MAG: hypothetical protein ACLTDR_15055 [Adlercreutzia equolifaciens]
MNKPMQGQFRQAGRRAEALLRASICVENNAGELQGGRRADRLRPSADAKKVDAWPGTSAWGALRGRHEVPAVFAGASPGGHGAHFSIAPPVPWASAPRRPACSAQPASPGHMGCDTVTVKNLEVAHRRE